MNIKTDPKQDTRTNLIEAGMQRMLEKGYTNTGIQEVLDAVSVPKGCFYHYFESKEDFALQIIDYFDESNSGDLHTLLTDERFAPLTRLKQYCLEKRETILSWQCRKGCLIGNLSQEMAD